MDIALRAKYEDAEGNKYIGVTKARYKNGYVYIVTDFNNYTVGDPVALTENEFKKLKFISY